jgi:hypothetical protein
MRTAKQIAASRANGQKSQGPTTAEGKAKSRFNALKHGIHAESQIMFDETAEDLAELAAEVHEQHSPADPTERFLVDTLISNEWRLRRLRRLEAELWQTGVDAYLTQNTEMERATSGDAFSYSGTAFERLQRIVNCCERNYHRALKSLAASQVARARARNTAQPEESAATSESPGLFRNKSAKRSTSARPEIPAEPVIAAQTAQPPVEDLGRMNPQETDAFEDPLQAISGQ